MDIKIIPASVGDCAILTQIAKKAKQHWGYSDAWMQLWENDLSVTPDCFVEGKIVKGEIGEVLIGFYALKNEGDFALLDGLWVLPEYHGNGYGKLLFHHAINQATSMGYHYVQLYADPHVDAFYQKLNGQMVGQIETQIKDRYLSVFHFQL
ncbi:GNAT family N-acetyltransferase [Myroides sp. 1354]|uniref:GNAT family N-acetyltransferase n=1 Tax=unclassified Myroides TaxID=2642485 RepID=UPI002577D9F1|nr:MULTISPECIES: GNAT family N-acetyltransferase [unclassified Myroides]MDM1046074.1 GNAT family N-acetyltransferase [Myroides sp. R163-1]MDM1057010.1 GNAT family N-acetyltransferase [Myroides sp. 1354]MDM1070205.1 GNAT family N-acetyltransferase [Myroides sp. 1372]